MVVLPYHHPLEIVKRLGTLDLLSHGRVIVGVGVGSLQPEFELLGHAFEGRGDRSDDAIRAIRAAWGVRVPIYEGDHYKFSGFIVEPSGLPRAVKVWVGGRTRRSLRRAAALGHAWMPFRLELEELSAMLQEQEIRELISKRDEPLELIFAPEPLVDPLGDREATRQTLRSYAAVGATGLSMRFKHESRSHYVEQMEAAVTLMKELDG
jgi:alkanesulfonate monooxygenase SsuD/methylene tetrahydromethanopterin reductase-like flavin-dependent oxidoreductase (luciferase family)